MNKLLAAILCAVLILCPFPCASAEEDADVGLKTSSPEEIMEALGVRFGVPEDAQDISYWIHDAFAQMVLTLCGVQYTARIQPTDSLENISDFGMDEWAISDECMVGWCEARAMMTQIDGQIITLCLWYDAAPGLMYSISACEEDLTGLGIRTAAESVFAPMQDDADGITAEDIYEALLSCTGYAGTAGSSLKNAIAACRLASFAAEHELADMDEMALSEAAADAVFLLTDEQREELSFNLHTMHDVLTEAFTDYESVSGLFEDAGIQEEIELLMAAPRTQEHFTALYEDLAAAGLSIE